MKPEYTEAALERGRWLFTQECTFVRGVPTLADLPDISLPEVAFAGRSNVGKSSLINALTQRLTLARTSNTPGRTQQLNYFDLGKQVFLVDMPGYGYAKVSKSMVAAWTSLMKTYLQGRSSLERVYLLIDARVGLKESDEEMMTLMDKAPVSYQIVLTKVDKVSKIILEGLIQDITARLGKHGAAHPAIISTSSRENYGIAELRAEITAFAKEK